MFRGVIRLSMAARHEPVLGLLLILLPQVYLYVGGAKSFDLLIFQEVHALVLMAIVVR